MATTLKFFTGASAGHTGNGFLIPGPPYAAFGNGFKSGTSLSRTRINPHEPSDSFELRPLKYM